MRVRQQITAVLVALGLAAGFMGGASASAGSRAVVHRYDVSVTGSVTTRVNDGATELRLSYELVFPRVLVRVNPTQATTRTAISAAKAGTASGRFELESAVASSSCAGSFAFAGLGAGLDVKAYRAQVEKPRFVLRALLTPAALQALTARVQMVSSGCGDAPTGTTQAPGGGFPAGPGIVGFISDSPGASFQRQTWQTASIPVRQLLDGRTFTLDTGPRQETLPDRELSGRVSVQFRPTAVR
jgi:hypothetical protein